MTDVVDHGFIRSVYFTDPNGIALEASWWVLDATTRPTDWSDERLFSDPDPGVAMRAERVRGRDHREHPAAGPLPDERLLKPG